MLLFNFLCLFYLMVLINSHTISKSEHEDYTENIYENLNDFDSTTKHFKHGRIQHQFRRQEKNKITKSKPKATHKLHIRPTHAPTKPHPVKEYLQDLRKKISSDAATEHDMRRQEKKKVTKSKPKATNKLHASIRPTHAQTKPHPVKVYLQDLRKKISSDAATELDMVQAYTAKVVNNLWDKLQQKIEEKIHGPGKLKRTKPKQSKLAKTRPLTTKKSFYLDKTVSNYDNVYNTYWMPDGDRRKKKRDIFNRKSKTIDPLASESSFITRAMSLFPYKLFDPTYNIYSTTKPHKTNSIIYYSPESSTFSSTNPHTYVISSTKDLYSSDNYSKVTSYGPFAYKHTDYDYTQETTQNSAKDELDFPGTAEIEALLDEIKARAIQMVADQSPGLNDMVTNTVTETTYAVDPMLNHIDLPRPMLISTLVSINIDNDLPENVVDRPTKSLNDTIAINNNNHLVAARSIKDDIYTMAEDLDGELQEEIKQLVRMVKAKMHSDRSRKALNEGMGTTLANKVSSKTIESTYRTSNRPYRTTTAELEKKLSKYRKRTRSKKPSSTHTIPVIEDEFDMLTLYEQMLTKDHENNKMKLLTTPGYPLKRQVRNIKVNKRNSETLADLSLKETIKKEKEGEGMPDDSAEAEDEQTKPVTIAAGEEEDKSTSGLAAVNDTSFEGLSDKLSYSQYVKGYKHYLEFAQKELNDRNYSNLVRYQAHKHHKVDDIGKFILSKIPDLPNDIIRNKRNFFDKLDMENEEGSTKGDDSWFRKHFYLLLDAAAQKKYHTSQTVSLKSSEPKRIVTRPEKKLRDASKEEIDEKNIDLDELMMDLHKQMTPCIEKYAQTRNQDNEENKNVTSILDGIYNRIHTRESARKNILQKLLSITKRNKTKQEHPIKSSRILIDDSDLYETTERLKRALKFKKVHKKKTTRAVKQSAKDTKNDQAYVDVNIVPNPTAIIKLKEDRKYNKFVNMFKKLSIPKAHKQKNKDEKKAHGKRDIRVQRFNPFKKLVNMFKNNDMYKTTGMMDESDFNFASKKIDAYKIVNYDRVPTAEEMSKMIPNITMDDRNEIRFNSGKFEKFGDLPSDYNIGKDGSGRLIPKITMKIAKPKQDYLKINVHKLKYPEDTYKVTYPEDDYNKMIMKTTKQNSYKTNYGSLPYYSQMTKTNTRTTPSTILSFRTAPYVKSFAITSPRFYDMTVGTNIKSVHQSSTQGHKFNEEVEMEVKKKKCAEENARIPERLFFEDSPISFYVTKTKNLKNFTAYPDHFNDLMLWHNDILNMEPVSSNPLSEVFKLRNIDIFGAPDIGSMQKEVLRIKEYIASLDDNKGKSKTVLSNRKETWNLNEEERSPKVRHMPLAVKINAQRKPERSMKSAVNGFKFNRLYSKAMKLGQVSGGRATTPSVPPATLPGVENTDEASIDTTILAYDDGDNIITDAAETKKTTKAPTIAIAKATTTNKKHHNFTDIITKTTTVTLPQQYYTTPVPMTKDDFDKFLKENNMDVQSVTTPLTDMWKYEDKWFFQKSKPKEEAKQNTKSNPIVSDTDLTKILRDKSNTSLNYNYDDYNLFADAKLIPDYDTQYIDQLEGLDDDGFESGTVKTHIINRPTKTIDKPRKMPMKRKLKKRIFDGFKKKETGKSDFENDDVDITIINLEDTTALPDGQIRAVKLQEGKDAVGDIETRFQIEKPADFGMARKIKPQEQKSNLHNDLLFDKKKVTIVTEKTSNTFAPDEHPHKFSSIFETIAQGPMHYSTYDSIHDTMHDPMHDSTHDSGFANFKDIWSKINKMKPDSNPKRIQISSQSVRYDVFYHEPMSTKSLKTKFMDHNKMHQKTTRKFADEHRPYTDTVSPYASEMSQIVKIARVIEAIDNSTEPSPKLRIDLPTFTPDASYNVDDLEDFTVTKAMNDNLLRYISGIALLQVINNNNLKTLKYDDMEFVGNGGTDIGGLDVGYGDGVAKSGGSNMSGVFRQNAEADGRYKVTTPMAVRVERAVEKDDKSKTTPPANMYLSSLHSLYNFIAKKNATKLTSTKKRSGFKLLPYFREKLLKLVGTKSSSSTTEKTKVPKTKTTKKVTRSTVSIVPKRKNTLKMATKTKIKSSVTTSKLEKPRLEGLVDYDFNDLSQISTVKLDESTLISDYLEALESKRQASNITTTMGPVNIEEAKLEKRDIQNQDAFTVKNVAALEVVVDMMKNGLSPEPRSSSFFAQNPSFNYPCGYPIITRSPTNSVQVHIAVPSLSKDKRSQDPLSVRRVFSAKMYTPVDIEYQIHSYEDGNEFTASPLNVANCDISPGIYLLVENPHKGSFSLKPIKKTLNVRQIDSDKLNDAISTVLGDKETTGSPKLGRVTLSKDFISAVNKQLLDFNSRSSSANLENASRHIVNIRDVFKIKENKGKETTKEPVLVEEKWNIKDVFKIKENKGNETTKEPVLIEEKWKHNIDWKAVKKFFGHERVCSCNLKSNKTMCAACAASDAVMSELIFEFDNIATYMNDHCTEIQTFFWMNPSGGRKLRDTVHKIDQALHDYYKRVKDKCQGRTCQTFSSYVGKKRSPNSIANNTSIEELGDKLEALADILNTVNHYQIVGDNIFIEKSKQALVKLSNCVAEKSIVKRSEKLKDKTVDNVYSLDKINVNIICKPETTEFDYNLYGTTPSTVSTILNYDDDEVKTKKPRIMFKNILSKLKKKKRPDKGKDNSKKERVKSKKRDVNQQIESPLISDSGGSFWHDYLTKGSTRKIEISDLSPQIYMNIIQTQENAKNEKSVKDKLLKMKDNLLVNISNAYNRYLNNEKSEKINEKATESSVLDKQVADTDKVSLDKMEKQLDEYTKATTLKPIDKLDSTIPPATKTKTYKKKSKKLTTTTKRIANMFHKKVKTATTKKHKHHSIISIVHNASDVDDIISVNEATKPYSIKTGNTTDDSLFTPRIITKTTKKVAKTEVPVKAKITTLKHEKTKNEGLLKKLKKLKTFTFSVTGRTTKEMALYEKEDMRPARSLETEPYKESSENPFPTMIDQSVNVISKQTTSSSTNPTILIIEDYDDSSELVFTIDNSDSNNVKDNIFDSVPEAENVYNSDFDRLEESSEDTDELKSLLASILKYEKDKIKDDWKRFVDNRKVADEDDMPDLYARYFALHTTTPRRKGKISTKQMECANGDYCMIKYIKDFASSLERPEPASLATTDKNKSTKRMHFMIVPDSLADKEGRVVQVYSRSIRERNALSSKKRIGKKHKIKVQPALPTTTSVLLNTTILVPSLATNATLDKPLATDLTTISNSDSSKVTSSSSKAAPSTSASTVDTSQSVVINDTEKTINDITTSKEACDPGTAFCICDIHTTYDHVKMLHKTLAKKDFERYARNLPCHQYKRPPKFFHIDISKKNNRNTDYTKRSYMVTPKQGLKWDWIRSKRSIEKSTEKKSYGYEVYDDYYDGNDDTYAQEDLGANKHLKGDEITLKPINKQYGDTPFRKADVSFNTKERNSKHFKVFKKGKVTVTVKIDHTKKYDEDVILNSMGQINYVDAFGSEFENDGFEKFFKDSSNVYRVKKRRKRTAIDMRNLMLGLKGLPPLRPALNEIYAMPGDDVTIECMPPDSLYVRKNRSRQDFVWQTDRPDMLKQDNVLMNDDVITVKAVGARNVGNYTCSKGSLMHRSVMLTLVSLPNFYVVFIPMYATNQTCTYDDLKAMQQLGPVMSREGCNCQDHDSVRLEEPLCLRDKLDASTEIKATAIMSSCPRPDLTCSVQCRRDLQCSLALLCAANALPLADVPVLITKNGITKILKPSLKSYQSLIVTHTLRKKDLTGHLEFHRLASSMSPGNVDIVVSCPAGYYLLVKQKICAICPSDTYSSEGENVCVSCPAGARAEPGAARCRVALARLRRYDQWWSPPPWLGVVCLICVVCGVVAACGGVSAGARTDVIQAKGEAKQCAAATCERVSPRARPLTPSRVILARFFRPSVETMASSTKATDSQETKFELWKEKNIPPPLPPIDFDI